MFPRVSSSIEPHKELLRMTSLKPPTARTIGTKRRTESSSTKWRTLPIKQQTKPTERQEGTTENGNGLMVISTKVTPFRLEPTRVQENRITGDDNKMNKMPHVSLPTPGFNTDGVLPRNQSVLESKSAQVSWLQRFIISTCVLSITILCMVFILGIVIKKLKRRRFIIRYACPIERDTAMQQPSVGESVDHSEEHYQNIPLSCPSVRGEIPDEGEDDFSDVSFTSDQSTSL